MARRESRKRPLHFEALESRETPSGLVGGEHGIHELVARRGPAAKSASFKGSATGTPTSDVQLPGGGYFATEALQGTATGIGGFTGTLNMTFASDLLHATSTGVLTIADGSQLDLSLGGVFRKIKNPTLKGTFGLSITGGTGDFANATGTGSLKATLNANNGALSFTFSGKISH